MDTLTLAELVELLAEQDVFPERFDQVKLHVVDNPQLEESLGWTKVRAIREDEDLTRIHVYLQREV